MNFNHLNEVGETYWEHLWCTIKYSCLFIGLSIVILIHGIFPFILTNTASNKIKELHSDLSCRQPKTHNE